MRHFFYGYINALRLFGRASNRVYELGKLMQRNEAQQCIFYLYNVYLAFDNLAKSSGLTLLEISTPVVCTAISLPTNEL